MTTLFITLTSLIVGAIVFSAICVKRCGFGALRVYFKRALKLAVLLLLLVSALIVCLLTCYTHICELLRGILSADVIEHVREELKIMAGADSAFVALQTIALTSGMISFVSCVVCSFGVLAGYVFDTYFVMGNLVATEKEGELVLNERCYTQKAFLLYSKFNS